MFPASLLAGSEYWQATLLHGYTCKACIDPSSYRHHSAAARVDTCHLKQGLSTWIHTALCWGFFIPAANVLPENIMKNMFQI